eukprot:TRINITY_DN49299_c0_g1_i1.p6 TRINITY_DN49299_c0_g1~~TRINITY_DN49299_c0_g1_i1.p6  ORF type:complete len:166 (-),score=3.54 TRINITY_DN49299_c0_g1_i1:1980-2441(-)
MDHLIQLPARFAPGQSGKEQHHTGKGQRRAPADNGPEDHLLPGIELLRGRMDILREQTAALLDPDKVKLVGDIVRHPRDKGQNQAQHEGKAHIVMRQLAPGRQRAKHVLAKKRQDDRTPENQVQTGQRQYDKGPGHQPVGKPFKGVEPEDPLC